MLRRLSTVTAAVAALVLGTSLSASAHVSIPGTGTKGGFAEISFRVPNERPDTSTVKIEVQLPDGQPLAFVSTKPMPGWESTVATAELPEPVEVHGEEITEAASTITWEGGEVGPGQYDDFSISAGPLPEEGDQMVFKVIQTYSDGEEVAWVQETVEGEEEPERPAPVLALVDGDDAHGEEAAPAEEESAADEGAAPSVSAVSQGDVDSANTKATIGIVVGVLGLLAGAAGIAAGRRRT